MSSSSNNALMLASSGLSQTEPSDSRIAYPMTLSTIRSEDVGRWGVSLSHVQIDALMNFIQYWITIFRFSLSSQRHTFRHNVVVRWKVVNINFAFAARLQCRLRRRDPISLSARRESSHPSSLYFLIPYSTAQCYPNYWL